MAMIGYARVSTTGQNLDVQISKLQGCDKLFQEKQSGLYVRPKLRACLEYVREGDVLVVTRLDRLARSTLHLCEIVAELGRKKVDLRVLDQQIDTGTPTGRLLFHILASIAQFETELRAERQMEGIVKAKERGVKFGRKKQLAENQITELRTRRANGETIKSLMEAYQLSKSAIYVYLKEG